MIALAQFGLKPADVLAELERARAGRASRNSPCARRKSRDEEGS